MSQLIVARRRHGAPRMRDSFVRAADTPSLGQTNRFGRVWMVAGRIAFASAIIVGILAMHSFLSPSSQASPMTNPHSVASAPSEMSTQSEVSTALHHGSDTSDTAVSGAIILVTDCAGCSEDTSMAAMLCILALLTAALMLLAPRLTGRWHRQLWLLLHRSFSASTQYVKVSLALTPLGGRHSRENVHYGKDTSGVHS
ncbi:hypothetical protein [Homoserinimonas sp. OAct 916]|uniref:hypothetical protein n=1 Tax=Homoserinimonas sp. OAct 916 TaxID=2211450 RepID=UPI00130062EA|nr:hypothetical protein [Homoserinimonas sp. OAct 916]